MLARQKKGNGDKLVDNIGMLVGNCSFKFIQSRPHFEIVALLTITLQSSTCMTVKAQSAPPSRSPWRVPAQKAAPESIGSGSTCDTSCISKARDFQQQIHKSKRWDLLALPR